MQTYIGVKMIQAEPMTKHQFDNFMEREPSAAGDEPDQEGYHVVYPDNYHSWSPKEVFEDAYLGLTASDLITEDDVLAFVPEANLITSKMGEKTAVAQAKCRTGFEITETAACVKTENYDQDQGTQIALDYIKQKLWGHLGFVLQWAMNGLNATVQNQGEQTSPEERQQQFEKK